MKKTWYTYLMFFIIGLIAITSNFFMIYPFFRTKPSPYPIAHKAHGYIIEDVFNDETGDEWQNAYAVRVYFNQVDEHIVNISRCEYWQGGNYPLPDDIKYQIDNPTFVNEIKNGEHYETRVQEGKIIKDITLIIYDVNFDIEK